MALNDILTSMDGARDALVTAINAKGGSLSQDSTLYQCANAIGSIESGGTDTTDATAGAGDILSGKTAYVNGEKITGTISSYTGSSLIIPGVEDKVLSTAEGIYLPKAVKVAGESELLAENIKKGVSIFGIVGTLEGGGGSSAEYYKCASVSSGASQPEGYNLTVEFYGFTINEAGTSYDRDSEKTVIRMTMQDTSASGLDRVWVSDDGAWKLMKYELPGSHISWGLYKTSRGDFEYFIDADSVINQDAMSAAWENGETYSDDVNPWVLTRIRWSDDPAWTDLTWTVSPAVSGGSTWSGYKAVQQENGGYTFEETVTTGLTYTTITPVVGSIYTADCMILVGYMVPAASASIPDSNLYIYMPLQEDISEPTANTTVYDSGRTSLTFNTVDGLKCAVFGGSSSLRLNGISSTFSNIENVTFSFWAKVNSETANSYVLAFYSRNDIQITASDKCNWVNYDGSSYTSFTCDVSNTTSWNHYAFVKDGSVWKIYLNGVMIASKTDAKSYFSIERDGLYIGTNAYNTSLYWKGWLTKLRIYTKVLTDAEILACAKELTPTA